MFVLAIQYRSSITKHYYEEALSEALDQLVLEHQTQGIIDASLIDVENREHHFYDADLHLTRTVKF